VSSSQVIRRHGASEVHRSAGRRDRRASAASAGRVPAAAETSAAPASTRNDATRRRREDRPTWRELSKFLVESKAVPTITFLGAAQTVTGSKYPRRHGQARVLVDCGLSRAEGLRERNWDGLPVEPRGIDAVVLTHAHLDTSATCRGWPRRGSAAASSAHRHRDLCRLVLRTPADPGRRREAGQQPRYTSTRRAAALHRGRCVPCPRPAGPVGYGKRVGVVPVEVEFAPPVTCSARPAS